MLNNNGNPIKKYSYDYKILPIFEHHYNISDMSNDNKNNKLGMNHMINYLILLYLRKIGSVEEIPIEFKNNQYIIDKCIDLDMIPEQLNQLIDNQQKTSENTPIETQIVYDILQAVQEVYNDTPEEFKKKYEHLKIEPKGLSL